MKTVLLIAAALALYCLIRDKEQRMFLFDVYGHDPVAPRTLLG